MYLGSITSYLAFVGIILIFLFVANQITEGRGDGDDDNGPKAA